MKCTHVWIERSTTHIGEPISHMIFKLENGHEYDPTINQCKQPWWISHMRGKEWFTQDIEEKAVGFLKDI